MVSSWASATNADGTVVVVSCSNGSLTSPRADAFRWTQGTGMVSLGHIRGANGGYTHAYDVSPDGCIVVGESIAGNVLGPQNAFI
jgi:uncharacterized membrane protein